MSEQVEFIDIENWKQRARCRDLDTNIFYPEDGLGVESAKAICANCVVITDCLEYALANREEYGVWGGQSERERRRIRSRRRLAGYQ